MILKEQNCPQKTWRKTEVPAGVPTLVSPRVTNMHAQKCLWTGSWKRLPGSLYQSLLGTDCTVTANAESRNVIMPRSLFEPLRCSEGNKACLRNNSVETGDTNVLSRKAHALDNAGFRFNRKPRSWAWDVF